MEKLGRTFWPTQYLSNTCRCNRERELFARDLYLMEVEVVDIKPRMTCRWRPMLDRDQQGDDHWQEWWLNYGDSYVSISLPWDPHASLSPSTEG